MFLTIFLRLPVQLLIAELSTDTAQSGGETAHFSTLILRLQEITANTFQLQMLSGRYVATVHNDIAIACLSH